jgi:hypothetical protein
MAVALIFLENQGRWYIVLQTIAVFWKHATFWSHPSDSNLLPVDYE